MWFDLAMMAAMLYNAWRWREDRWSFVYGFIAGAFFDMALRKFTAGNVGPPKEWMWWVAGVLLMVALRVIQWAAEKIRGPLDEYGRKIE